jgi:5'-3' exonuclease
MHYNKPEAFTVHLDAILKEFSMTPNQFQVFCILCGCDFVQRLPLIGPAKLLTLHKKTPDDVLAQA